MFNRLTAQPLALALILSGCLFIVFQVVLPRADRIGPIVRYGLLGLGSSRQAAAQLDQEIQVITERIRERQSAADVAPPPNFTWPTPGWGEITSPWGRRSHPILRVAREHPGIDIGAPTGAEIGAAQEGEVILADQFNGYGRILVIDHGGGWASVYAHLSEARVAEGERVEAGQVIGVVGTTGRVTGPHLHLELHRAGQAVNPLTYIVVP